MIVSWAHAPRTLAPSCGGGASSGPLPNGLSQASRVSSVPVLVRCEGAGQDAGFTDVPQHSGSQGHTYRGREMLWSQLDLKVGHSKRDRYVVFSTQQRGFGYAA